MIAAAMESKRLGLCQKSLFSQCPNHLTEQWASEFLRLYPSANILVTTKKDFEMHNRKKFCARVSLPEIMTLSLSVTANLSASPISIERQETAFAGADKGKSPKGIEEVKSSGAGSGFTIKQLEKNQEKP